MLMALVAVAAVGMGASRLHRLSRAYQGRATAFEKQGRFWSARVESDAISLADAKAALARSERLRDEASDEIHRKFNDTFYLNDREWVRFCTEQVRRAERQRAFHAEMARKYDRAARYPFLSIAPDPPEPQ
jgi:hypothetical protein